MMGWREEGSGEGAGRKQGLQAEQARGGHVRPGAAGPVKRKRAEPALEALSSSPVSATTKLCDLRQRC